ncbi:MAG: hypothetical protein O2894_07525 [Planctomycetota bacterium]|nr:hypothetical protein [Planctomycetota bacterium]
MGTAIKIIVGVAIALVAGCAACLFFVHKAGSDVQREFYSAVATGDVSQVKALCHPELAAQLDDPILGAWMKALNDRLGPYTGMSTSNFNLSINHGSAGKEVKSEGIAEFEKGTADSKLKFLDDRITAFSVESDLLKEWLTAMDDATFYDARARAFLAAVEADDSDGAWAMMHESLQHDISAERWPTILEQIKSGVAGADLTLSKPNFTAGPPQRLTLTYQAGEREISLTFTASGMRMHLTAINMPGR